MPGTNAQTTGNALPTTDRGEVQMVRTGTEKARSNSALAKIKDGEFKVNLDSVPSESSYCVQFCFQGYRLLLSCNEHCSSALVCKVGFVCLANIAVFLLKNSGIFA